MLCTADVHSIFAYIVLLDRISPAVSVFALAPLNTCESVVEVLSGLSDLSVINSVLFALVAEFSDGRYDSGSTAAPSLLESSVLHSLLKLVNRDKTLGYLVSVVTEDLDTGLTRDTGEDRA